MALIDEFDAESAIQDLADHLPEECEDLIGTMVDCDMTAPDAWIEQHSEWRETGGIPHFRAIIRFTNEGGWPLIGGHFVHVEVRGTFAERRGGLSVKEWHAEDCRLVDKSERQIKAF